MPDPSVPNPLPVTIRTYRPADQAQVRKLYLEGLVGGKIADRKSTRLNSSHEWISYAVFCLKKKNNGVSQSLAPAFQPRPRGRGTRARGQARPRGTPEIRHRPGARLIRSDLRGLPAGAVALD